MNASNSTITGGQMFKVQFSVGIYSESSEIFYSVLLLMKYLVEVFTLFVTMETKINYHEADRRKDFRDLIWKKLDFS